MNRFRYMFNLSSGVFYFCHVYIGFALGFASAIYTVNRVSEIDFTVVTLAHNALFWFCLCAFVFFPYLLWHLANIATDMYFIPPHKFYDQYGFWPNLKGDSSVYDDLPLEESPNYERGYADAADFHKSQLVWVENVLLHQGYVYQAEYDHIADAPAGESIIEIA